jgi:hypothetical protein
VAFVFVHDVAMKDEKFFYRRVAEVLLFSAPQAQ